MARFLFAAIMLFSGTTTVFAQGSSAKPTPDIVQSLAPTGKIRAAINFGNGVLAQKDPKTGEPRGITR